MDAMLRAKVRKLDAEGEDVCDLKNRHGICISRECFNQFDRILKLWGGDSGFCQECIDDSPSLSDFVRMEEQKRIIVISENRVWVEVDAMVDKHLVRDNIKALRDYYGDEVSIEIRNRDFVANWDAPEYV